eukprot:2345852-Rhodomonas_salina.1
MPGSNGSAANLMPTSLQTPLALRQCGNYDGVVTRPSGCWSDGGGGLDGITGTLTSTADKGWGATHFGLVSRRQRSQGRRSCSRSRDAASGRVRRANAHGRGGEEALDGVARVDGNRSH